MAKAGDDPYKRILMAAPMPRVRFKISLNNIKELLHVFDGVFIQHQSGEARVYELSDRAKTAYNEYCSQVVEEQNARFQEQSASSGQSSSSSKDTKHVLRLSVILHVLFHTIDKALGLIPPASTLSLRISKENIQRAIVINEYSVDVKAVLKEVRKNAFYVMLLGAKFVVTLL